MKGYYVVQSTWTGMQQNNLTRFFEVFLNAIRDEDLHECMYVCMNV